MTDLPRILKASAPLTLAGVPAGFLPWLLADLARAAAAKGSRAVFVADDEAAMRIADRLIQRERKAGRIRLSATRPFWEPVA